MSILMDFIGFGPGTPLEELNAFFSKLFYKLPPKVIRKKFELSKVTETI